MGKVGKVGSQSMPSVFELSFGQATAPTLPPAAAGALTAINRFTPVSIVEVGKSDGWFRLQSDYLGDADLFHTLRKSWPLASGRSILNCSVIYCENGPDSGVWLHHLSNEEMVGEHLPGCHRIASWS